MAKVASPSVELRATTVEGTKTALGELVMAWARDIETGDPRCIGEIDADHCGGKCGCEYPSRRLVLIAVNAAKDKVIKRPHFRHTEGAQRDECAILAARAAAMRLLAEEGLIDLPRRRLSATAEGLSGALHAAWVEAPAQKVRVACIDFRDRAFAMLTLDDGRKLRVALTGGISDQVGDDGDAIIIPTITIDVDSSIAGMDPIEIRKRLQLLPGNICWRTHWNDVQLLAGAQRQATDRAVDALDWLPDGIELPDGLSPAMKRESLLHHEVKRILERAGVITVPGLEVEEEHRTAGQPTLQRRWSVGDRILQLTNTRLEHRMRPLIPDVVSEARAEDGSVFDPLIIEVTVTNVIDDERRGRLRAQGVAALEIDLSMTGGRVTRSELHRSSGAQSWKHGSGRTRVQRKTGRRPSSGTGSGKPGTEIRDEQRRADDFRRSAREAVLPSVAHRPTGAPNGRREDRGSNRRSTDRHVSALWMHGRGAIRSLPGHSSRLDAP